VIRIAFDMDGVLADFASEYRAIEQRLFGQAAAPVRAGSPEEEAQLEEGSGEERSSADARKGSAGLPETDEREGDQPASPEVAATAHELRRRRDAVWKAIHATLDFWTTLKPIEPDAVRRIHTLMLKHRWEVFFITQRPATEGDTVQRQTQRWLVAQGFDLPSVLVIGGSRGAAAGALRLSYHVDDSPKNCIDVRSQSNAQPLLILGGEQDETLITSVRRLRIGTAPAIGAALDILDQAAAAHAKPPLLSRLARLVGWQ
jgi:hypothetical protein